MATTKEKCGCKHDGARWVVECDKHRGENDAVHARASRDRRVNPRPSAQVDEAPPLGDEFFEKAVLTQPGESVIDTVRKADLT